MRRPSQATCGRRMRLQVCRPERSGSTLGDDFSQAAQAEPGAPDGAFDDLDHGFDGLLAQFVEGFGIFGLQPDLHGDPPGFGDPSRRLGFRRRSEVVRPIATSGSIPPARLEFLHRRRFAGRLRDAGAAPI